MLLTSMRRGCGASWRPSVPRQRKVQNYAPEEKVAQQRAAVGAKINAVRAAFKKLYPLAHKNARKLVPQLTDMEFGREFNRNLLDAVHNVAPLYDTAAIPTAEFRTENNPDGKRRRRRKEIEGTFVALMCRLHYELITHADAKVGTGKKPPHKPCGRFYDLVKDVFAALDLQNRRGEPISAENRARAVCKAVSVMGEPGKPMPMRRRSKRLSTLPSAPGAH
jgi:hypothetical protein